MPDRSYYRGMRVVVTGAASGMGKATAKMLAQAGAEVLSLDRNQVSDGTYIPVDLSDRASIDTAFERIGGSIGALFSCAGLPHGPAMNPLTVFSVNFLGMRHFTEKMMDVLLPGSGAVIVSSVGGMGWQQSTKLLEELMRTDFDGGVQWAKDHPNYVSPSNCYTASKQASTYYTMYKCREFTERGLRINAISPGPTQTGMSASFAAANSQAFMDGLRQALTRDATPEDQANAMLFLNDGTVASYINGANLYVDNGMASRALVGQLNVAPSEGSEKRLSALKTGELLEG